MSQRFIAFHYTLKNTRGEVVETTFGTEPLNFVEGTGQIIPGLEKHLLTMKAGDRNNIHVPATDAYGERDERLKLEVPLTQFPNPDRVAIGMEYEVEVGDDATQLFRIIQLNTTHAILDGNHPLAGENLDFEVEVKETRSGFGN
jgi:FKBP-type peptidyl-prolyl cis-trans isomerase SlyD